MQYFSAVIFIGYAGKFGWSFGLSSIWIGVGNALLGSLVAWLIMAKRTKNMTVRLSSKTMPEFFYKRYNSNAEAAKDYDVTPEQIKGCSMNHIKGLKSGHSVVKARLVESIKDGKIVINKEIIDEYAKKAEQVRDRAIWAKDAEGKKRRFKSVENASTELGIPVKAINRCLSGKSQTTRDYHFEYVKESPSIPIERKKRDKTIFAMDCEGNIKTFADIDTAARVLDVEKEDIQQLLKIGSLKGKRTSLKGYVFSTANDE